MTLAADQHRGRRDGAPRLVPYRPLKPFSPGAGDAGRAALAAGAPILCDCRMVAERITRSRFKAGNQIVCTLNAPSVPELAKKMDNTRSAAALELWRPLLEGSVVAIGNAPTALFHLLNMLYAGASKPALILGFPVGYVGAAASRRPCPKPVFMV